VVLPLFPNEEGLERVCRLSGPLPAGAPLNLHEVGDMRPIQMGSYIGFTKAGKANPPSIKEVSEKFHIPPGAFFLNARKGNSKR